MTLKQEALAAYAATAAAEEAAKETTRREYRQAATQALRAVLKRPDGTSMTLNEAGLEAVYADLSNLPESGAVVWSTGDVHLAAQYKNGQWVIRLVRGEDRGWVPIERVPPIQSLADLGAAMAR